MRDYSRSKSFQVTSDRARGMRPVLRWIKESAPRKKERNTAYRLLQELEGIREVKQLLLNKDESEMFLFVLTEFPSGVESERQLSLFSLLEPTTTLTGSGVRKPKAPPVYRTELSEEEQAERDETVGRLGYQPQPDSFFTAKMIKRGQQEEKEE